MPYTAPIYDRVLSDVTNRTSKGFINVVDWVRINDNTIHIAGLVEDIVGYSIVLNSISTPTVTDKPNLVGLTGLSLNGLLNNIEKVRVAAEVIGTIEIKDDWVPGINQQSPTYLNVNDWERNIHLIYTAYSLTPVRFARTGVAISGVGKTRNNKWRHYA